MSEHQPKKFSRPSATSQTNMSTTDLGGGHPFISGPTGFVHFAGGGRAHQGRCSSISGASVTTPTSAATTTTAFRDPNRCRARELANIDPKFTSQSGLCSSSELETSRGCIRIQHLTGTTVNPSMSNDGQPRFPRLEECAHFHYEYTEIGPLVIQLLSEEDDVKPLIGGCKNSASSVNVFSVQVTSLGKSWTVRRSYENFELLDKMSHQCIFDRKYSQLTHIPQEENVTLQNGHSHKDSVRQLLSSYLHRFSTLAGPVITCGPVLNWFELDNRGHRLIVTDDCAINTPAVAAAYAIKRYAKQASDEISFEVGDMISVIDMPPPDESIWWRGKRGFEVGFFPCECVEVIGDKVPHGLNLPMGCPALRKDSVGSADDDEDSPSSEPTKPVLRKHGKLISFFRSFILSRPARGKLKKSGILKERVFGCDLSEHLLNTGQDVPKVLTHCAEFIETRGIIDGIYRLSGIASNIQKLRVAFDEDRVPNLYDDKAVLQDIHSVASLLKMYFRELPNPVCTYHLYDKFVEAAKAPENQRLVLMRDVVQQLPPPNYRTLEYLSRHLYRVSLRGSDTGMTAKNVAIVWAPNLLRAKCLEVGGVAALQGVGVQAVVTEYLIRYCELIFSDKMPTYSPQPVGNEETPKKCRPKSLAISTPTKLLSLEEARSRANNLANQEMQQRYIEVGGGPNNLPQKYHTVIDLRGRKGGSVKQRKSPIGWKAIFTGGKSKSKLQRANKPTIDLVNNQQNGLPVTDHDLRMAMPRSALRPVKSAESLAIIAPVQRSCSERRPSRDSTNLNNKSSRPLSMESDDIGPLEIVSKALAGSNINASSSPRCHSRSSSHDSYFERKLSVQFKLDEEEEEEKMDSTLDLSEIQVNFDLEENEMKIFSEDEAMLSNSVGSDLSKSPMEEQPVIPCDNKVIMRTSSSNESPKLRKMSFREKFKRFTSPTPVRKLEHTTEEDESSSNVTTRDSVKRTSSSLREKIVCALSPESLRKRTPSNTSSHHSESKDVPDTGSPKKKKTSSPVPSPPGASGLVKRSKIQQDEQEHKTELPLSPSINFIDASMHESAESTHNKTTETEKKCENRFSTTSSTDGEELQPVDQLVIAQVHHDPIPENRVAEEMASATVEQEVKPIVTEVEESDRNNSESFSTKQPDEAETNVAEEIQEEELSPKLLSEEVSPSDTSVSIAGATVSENESFSIPSVAEDLSSDIQMVPGEEEEEVFSSSSTTGPSMLPANHVIQYSPRSSTKEDATSDWSRSLHYNPDPEPMDCDDEIEDRSLESAMFLTPVLLERDTALADDDAHQQQHVTTQQPREIMTACVYERKTSCVTMQLADHKSSPVPAPRNLTTPYTTMEIVELRKPSGRVQNSQEEEEKPSPKPRTLSVTQKEEVQEEEEPKSLPSMDGRLSAQEGSIRKISFATAPSSCLKPKLSTFSLQKEHEEKGGQEDGEEEEEVVLQRRNSIHNVPYVDVNDPGTRERMERYKEERRSMLRAKYKVEDYKTHNNTSSSPLRKMPVGKTMSEVIEPPVSRKWSEPQEVVTVVVDPKRNKKVEEIGLIDEDVNVKERAALFGERKKPASWAGFNVVSNNKKSTTTTTTTVRPSSDSNVKAENRINYKKNHHHHHHHDGPASPSKIRDMAALFEQKN